MRSTGFGDDNLDGVPERVALEDGGAVVGTLEVVNYHNTPARLADAYREQLDAAAGRTPVAGFDALFADGGPGGEPLWPVLYEGYRNGHEVALELIEAAGLVALVMVPVGFLDEPVAGQHAWALAHELALAGPDDPERIAMSWDELRDVVARGHVVACHTASHCGQDAIRDAAAAERELVAPKRRLEEELGVAVDGVAFLWGTPFGTDPFVDEAMLAAGYRYVVSGARIQRLPGSRA
jgi:hypothetical protein